MKNLLFPQRDEDDGETFYESYQTPHPRPAPRPPLPPSVKSPASAVSPSYPASEYSDWDTETTGSEADADKTPTHRHKEASLTLEELQEAAKRLNLSLVTSPASVTAVLFTARLSKKPKVVHCNRIVLDCADNNQGIPH